LSRFTYGIFKEHFGRLDVSGLGLANELLDNFTNVSLKKGTVQGTEILLLSIKTRATWPPAVSLCELSVLIALRHRFFTL